MTTANQFFSYADSVNKIYADWPPLAHALGWDDLCMSWQMESFERTGLIAVVGALRPAVAIEIGTHTGGSLAVLSRFSERVFSLDIQQRAAPTSQKSSRMSKS